MGPKNADWGTVGLLLSSSSFFSLSLSLLYAAKQGKILEFKKDSEKVSLFFFNHSSLASATKLLSTHTGAVLWLLFLVDLELKVQAGHGSRPVFRHLPIYFGKKAPVLGAGLETGLRYKQHSTILSALFKETNNNLNLQWENNKIAIKIKQ